MCWIRYSCSPQACLCASLGSRILWVQVKNCGSVCQVLSFDLNWFLLLPFIFNFWFLWLNGNVVIIVFVASVKNYYKTNLYYCKLCMCVCVQFAISWYVSVNLWLLYGLRIFLNIQELTGVAYCTSTSRIPNKFKYSKSDIA